jgi:hypothetical protein
MKDKWGDEGWVPVWKSVLTSKYQIRRLVGQKRTEISKTRTKDTNNSASHSWHIGEALLLINLDREECCEGEVSSAPWSSVDAKMLPLFEFLLCKLYGPSISSPLRG